MDDAFYEIESKRPFSESLIWQLNQHYYHDSGIEAWSKNIVPHHMTSNSKVGKTYAELIFAILKDQKDKKEIIYILELGAGNGRLAFHVLKHLELLIASTKEVIAPYCYILSDIVESNLSFYRSHPQLQTYFEQGVLDLTYFNGISSKKLNLQYSDKTISSGELNQPLIAIANYFFDSLPTDLFYIDNKIISSCSVAINSVTNPQGMNAGSLIEHMELAYSKSATDNPIFKDHLFNEIINEYKEVLSDTYLFFPKKSLECIQNLQSISKAGLVLLTMDKGYHEIENLSNKKEPEIITHGSFSIWVNYHAIIAHCKKQGGKTFFPKFSNFHLEIGCLIFSNNSETYTQTDAAYQQFVNNFGPDDFNSMKHLAYFNLSRLKIKDLIALYRLSDYDSSFFIKLFPRLKQVSKSISILERKRIGQTLENVWNMYFNINENVDLAYELGGMFYDLAFYEKALTYFQYSINVFGNKPDIYYNQALCYYQLRQDDLFAKTMDEAKLAFPDYELFKNLDQLDMN